MKYDIGVCILTSRDRLEHKIFTNVNVKGFFKIMMEVESIFPKI